MKSKRGPNDIKEDNQYHEQQPIENMQNAYRIATVQSVEVQNHSYVTN